VRTGTSLSWATLLIVFSIPGAAAEDPTGPPVSDEPAPGVGSPPDGASADASDVDPGAHSVNNTTQVTPAPTGTPGAHDPQALAAPSPTAGSPAAHVHGALLPAPDRVGPPLVCHMLADDWQLPKRENGSRYLLCTEDPEAAGDAGRRARDASSADVSPVLTSPASPLGPGGAAAAAFVGLGAACVILLLVANRRGPAAPSLAGPPDGTDLEGLAQRVAARPLDAAAAFQFSLELFRRGRDADALRHLDRAVRLRPDLLVTLLERPECGAIRTLPDVKRMLRRILRDRERAWTSYA
jgi:hypothetical protein